MHGFHLRGRTGTGILAIVVMTAAVGFVLLLATVRFASEELRQTAGTILRQNISRVDTMLQTLYEVNEDFVVSTGYLWQFMNGDRQTPYDRYKMLLRFDRYYDTIRRLYPKGVSLYMVAGHTETLYLNGYLFGYREFLNEYGRMPQLPPDGEGAEQHSSGWGCVRGISLYQGYDRFLESSAVYMARPYPKDGGVYLFVDTSVLGAILAPSLPTPGAQMYVIAPDGSMILSAGDDADAYFEEAAAFAREDFGSPTLVHSVTSEYTGWRYALRLPRSLSFTLSSSLGAVFIFCASLWCIVIGAITIMLFIRPYKAVAQMADQLRVSVSNISARPASETRSLRPRSSVFMDDILYLRASLGHLIEQGDKLRGEIDRYRPAMQAKLIADLLHPGRIVSFPQHAALMRESGLSVCERSFAVLAVRAGSGDAAEITEYSREWRSGAPPQTEWLCVDGADGSCVILLTCEELLTRELALDAAEWVLARLRESALPGGETSGGAVTATVGTGPVSADYMGIPVSYRAAKLAMEHCLLLEGAGVMEYDQIQEASLQNVDLSGVSDDLDEIVDALSRSAYEQADKQLDTLYEKAALRRFSPPMARAISSSLITGGMKLCSRIDANLTHLIGAYPQGILSETESLSTMQDHRDFVKNVFSEFRAALEYRKKNVGSARLAQRIVKYLDENYTNPELCANVLSDTFDVTPAHISRVFKEYTGVNLSVYLSKLRIERAKLLLKAKSGPVGAIAGAVGYASTQTFIRSFKKETGIPPGEYTT
jgi:AraC-like DNA-binding protein